MNKTLTNITTDTAIADAKIMKAADFCEKYDDIIEYLDVDNIMDYNEGYVNFNLYTDNGTETFLFLDGQYQA
jgi:hypothetical protein